MKKIFTLFAAVAVIVSCYGAPLNPSQALQLVTKSSKEAKSIKDGGKAMNLVLTGEASDGQATYYVFTNNSGTLFVSADDAVKPLLGYTDSGNFDVQNMPPQLKWWLEQYSKEIEWASHRVASVQDEPAQSRAASRANVAIAPMLKTTWDQSAPYNNYMPSLNGTRTVTGCVATSMAQVMKYFEWPQSQVAAISYTWNNTTLASPATTLDWSNMLNSYSGAYTTTQGNAVARLMQLAGYSVEMNYNTSANGGSGAYSEDIRNALVNTFGYDVAIDYAMRDYYDAEEWAQMIYDNLQNIGPVIYDGTGTAGGHSFVCDGYDGNGKFHMNWGWSGSSDGYFVLSALNPSALGTGGGAGGFNSGQGAVLNIQRPQSGSTAPTPYIACDDVLSGSTSSRVLTVKTVSSNGGFWNFGCTSGSFIFGVKLENASTGATSYVTSSNTASTLKPLYGKSSYTVSIASSLAAGTYKVYPVYKVNSGSWTPIKLKNTTTQYLTLNVTSSGIQLEEVEEEEAVTLVSWRCPTGFISEKAYQGYLTLSSTYRTAQSKTLTAYLCELENNQYYIEADLGTSTVTIPAKSEVEMEFSGTLGSMTPGTYYLVFAENNSIVGSLQVAVTSEGNFSVEGYTLTPDELTQGGASTVDVEISSSYATEQTAAFGLFLCTLGDTSLNVEHSYGSKTATFPANGTVTLTYSTTIPEKIAVGSYYLVVANSAGKVVDYMMVDVAEALSAIDTIGVDNVEGQVKYFNLQGIEIPVEAATPGLYIRKSDSKAEKVLVK